MRPTPSVLSLTKGASGPSQSEVGNVLLRLMPPRDYERLRPFLHRIEITSDSWLTAAGDPIDRLCFPEGGIISFVEVLGDGRRISAGLLGREGFAGWPSLMGNDRWPHELVVRGSDATALAIDAEPLHAALDASDSLRLLLLRYASSFVAQITTTLTSNLIQSVEQRTARWLLMYHDRIDGDEFAVTHDELGIMLGVRRASITDALHQLEGIEAVRSSRGRLQIRNRQRLIALVGDTYGRAESEYARLLVAGV